MNKEDLESFLKSNEHIALKKVVCKIVRRMHYIDNKLEGCMGYSSECKRVRKEELDNVLNIIIWRQYE